MAREASKGRSGNRSINDATHVNALARIKSASSPAPMINVPVAFQGAHPASQRRLVQTLATPSDSRTPSGEQPTEIRPASAEEPASDAGEDSRELKIQLNDLARTMREAASRASEVGQFPDLGLVDRIESFVGDARSRAARLREKALRLGVELPEGDPTNVAWFEESEEAIQRQQRHANQRSTLVDEARTLLRQFGKVTAVESAFEASARAIQDAVDAVFTEVDEGELEQVRTLVTELREEGHPLCCVRRLQNVRPPKSADYFAAIKLLGERTTCDLVSGFVQFAPTTDESSAATATETDGGAGESDVHIASAESDPSVAGIEPLPFAPSPAPVDEASPAAAMPESLGKPTIQASDAARHRLAADSPRRETQTIESQVETSETADHTPATCEDEEFVGHPDVVKPTGDARSGRPMLGDAVASLGTTEKPDASGPEPARTDDVSAAKSGLSATWTGDVGCDLSGKLIPDFPAFSRSFRIAADGSCKARPVGTDEDVARWSTAAAIAFEAHRWAELYVFSRATESAGAEAVLTPTDVRSIAAVLQEPRSSRAGRYNGRAESLRQALAFPESWSTSLRIRLVLHAIRPDANYWTSDEVDRLVARARFSDPDLSLVLHYLLQKVGQYAENDENAVDELRRAVRAGRSTTLKEAEAQLADARRSMQEFVRTHKQIGGAVKRTHCRRAWVQFMTQVEDRLRHFYPSSTGEAANWNTRAQRTRIESLTTQHAEIADRGGALYIDRRKMDRAALELADCARAVNDAMGLVQQLRQPGGAEASVEPAVVDAAQRLATPAHSFDAIEQIARELVWRTICSSETVGLGDSSACNVVGAPLAFTLEDLTLRPLILDAAVRRDDASNHVATRDSSTDGASVSMVALDVDDIADFACAAQVLSESARAVDTSSPPSVDRLIDVYSNMRRPDLARLAMSYLAADIRRDDLSRFQQSATAEADGLGRLLHLLRREASRLDALAWGHAASLLRGCRAAERALDMMEAEPVNAPLFERWITEVTTTVRQLADRLVSDLQESVKRELVDDAVRDEGLRLIEQGLYAHAQQLLRGASVAPARAAVRQTLWRHEAAQRWPNASASLVASSGTANVPLGELLQFWSKAGSRLKGADAALVRRLLLFSLPGIPEPTDEAFRQMSREVRAVYRSFRELSGLNPCYVPQLHAYARLLVKVVSATGSVGSYADEVVAASQDYHAQQAIVLVLSPGVSEQHRREALRRLRERAIPAAVLDDLDLLRLTNPPSGVGNRTLALFELFLEQQDWGRFSPFAAPEGQQVRIEMFTGRQNHADDIATRNRYSRVFSGRKLGKSALLRYVADRYDGTVLPSGNTLKVLFVSVVGRDDRGVVEAIEEAFRKFLNVTPPSVDINNGASAADRLTSIVRSALEAQPRQSLLVILDEADEFIQNQLANASDSQKDLVDWRMRELEAEKDQSGLSRIRFICSGYIVANTKLGARQDGGAWGNWGQTLQLAPLQPDEAERLVAGPLARLGVDASEQAPAIAYRCGYQPAVILRFGERLLELLRERRGERIDARIQVTADDVMTVFQDQVIQEEIRNIVSMNFTGSRAAGLAFNVALLEFSHLPPGSTIVDASTTLSRQLQEACSDEVGAEAGRSPLTLSELSYALDECVARQLLQRVRDGQRGASRQDNYRLTFPHHLQLLLHRDHIEHLRSLARSFRDVPNKPEGPIVARQTLLSIANYLDPHEARSLGLRGVVIATVWDEVCVHPVGNIFSWLQSQTRAKLDVLRERDIPQLESGTTPEPWLLYGGTKVLRWALEREQCGDGLAIFGLQRIPQARAWWWFNRVRGVEFSPDVVSPPTTIDQLTGGVPWLLREFDAHLMAHRPDGDLTVSSSQFNEICARFERSMPDLVAQLAPDAGTPVSLNKREYELLRMIALASRHTGGGRVAADDLYIALTEMWFEVARESGWAEPPQPLCPDDAMPLRMLHELGLVATRESVDHLRRTLPFAKGSLLAPALLAR